MVGVGGGVVFDYGLAKSQLTIAERVALGLIASRVKRMPREPWRTFFEPEPLARDLAALGFGRIEDLGGDAINARYFADRADRLAVGGIGTHSDGVARRDRSLNRRRRAAPDPLTHRDDGERPLGRMRLGDTLGGRQLDPRTGDVRRSDASGPPKSAPSRVRERGSATVRSSRPSGA